MDERYTAEIAGRFGPRLRELRKKADMTQADLAKRCGLRQASIADYEAGNNAPTWPNVIKIAHALGVTPDAFLTAAEEIPKENPKTGKHSDRKSV